MSETLFETDRIVCRRWAAQDLDALHEVYSDPVAMRWVGDGNPITRTQCIEWLHVTETNYNKRGYGMFALVEKTTGTVVGFCGLVHPGGQIEPEIKYALLRSRWGDGLASEAIPALLAYGAAAHGLRGIIATVAAENIASQKVLAKAGMILQNQRTNDDSSVTHVYEWRLPAE